MVLVTLPVITLLYYNFMFDLSVIIRTSLFVSLVSCMTQFFFSNHVYYPRKHRPHDPSPSIIFSSLVRSEDDTSFTSFCIFLSQEIDVPHLAENNSKTSDVL